MTHELRVWPEPFEAIRNGTCRATARRCDDRLYTVGDELCFHCYQGNGPKPDPIRARITRIERNAGPHGLYGIDSHQTVGMRLVAFAVIHFVTIDEACVCGHVHTTTVCACGCPQFLRRRSGS